MNLAQIKNTTQDPRIQQLLSQADACRSKHKDHDAVKLEAEAEALFAATEQVSISIPRDHLKDLKPLQAMKALFTVKNGATRKPIQIFARRRIKPDTEEQATSREMEAAEKRRWQGPERSRVVAMLAALPHFNPILHLNKGSNSGNSNSEVTQFGLATAGAGLMAVEPAAGGILLMFSCVFQAAASEDVDEAEESESSKDPEQVEQSKESGLFLADSASLKWLISDA